MTTEADEHSTETQETETQSAETESTETQSTETQETETQNKEMFSESESTEEAGDGRPPSVPEAFWDKDTKTVRIDELAKSREHYRAQHNRLLNDESGVPEDISGYLQDNKNEQGNYLFAAGEGANQEIPADDPVMLAHLALSQEHNLTKKQSDGYLQGMMKALHEAGAAEPIDTKFEESKLGENGAERVTGVKLYLDNITLPEGMDSTDSMAEFKEWVSQKASRTIIVEALMKEGGVHNIPPVSDTDMATADENMIEYDKLLEDPEALDENPAKKRRLEHLGSLLFPG